MFHVTKDIAGKCLSPTCDAYIRQWTPQATPHNTANVVLVQVMACQLFGTKPLPEPMLVYCQSTSWKQISVKLKSDFYHFHSGKCIWNCRQPKWWTFCPRWDELIHISTLDDITMLLSSNSCNISTYCSDSHLLQKCPLCNDKHVRGLIVDKILKSAKN